MPIDPVRTKARGLMHKLPTERKLDAHKLTDIVGQDERAVGHGVEGRGEADGNRGLHSPGRRPIRPTQDVHADAARSAREHDPTSRPHRHRVPKARERGHLCGDRIPDREPLIERAARLDLHVRTSRIGRGERDRVRRVRRRGGHRDRAGLCLSGNREDKQYA